MRGDWIELRRQIKLLLPAPLRKGLTFAVYSIRDALDYARGRRDPLIPPTRLMYEGERSYAAFRENGDEFLAYFRELAGLQPHHCILDVGCGLGRKTRPLTRYLNEQGRYEGVDIVPEAIQWCTRHIASHFPNFHFRLLDVGNRCYNPDGSMEAAAVTLPFADASFDFVILASVFTHMLPDGAERYLREISRVLKDGQTAFVTFFLRNPGTDSLAASGKSRLRFQHQVGICRTVSARVPEEAVCYDESVVRALFEKHGLVIRATHYGAWSGRPQCLTFQDLVIAGKRAAPCAPSAT